MVVSFSLKSCKLQSTSAEERRIKEQINTLLKIEVILGSVFYAKVSYQGYSRTMD
jgi:hypothetical protein